MVELPVRITGLDPIQCWGSTAFFDKNHGWTQIQRAAVPDVSVVFDNGGDPYHTLINSTGPSADLAGRPANPATDPATGVWGTVRDKVAAVVAARKTYRHGVHGQPTAMAYGAFVADTLLAKVLRYTPGTTARWDPSQVQGMYTTRLATVVVDVDDLGLRHRGWATSWVFRMVGRPVPMSRNCRIPASLAR